MKSKSIELIRTNSTDKDFVKLVELLDAELAVIDGDDHAFYDQYNSIDNIKYVVVAIKDGQPISCGGIKEYDSSAMEVKRMYTLQGERGQGLATLVLNELELWAWELGFGSCMLETGKVQLDAVQLYKKNGYKVIPNYGQYEGVENSVCFEKRKS